MDKVKNGREYWLDALKGLAMIFVIAGHSGLPMQVSNVIYFFHMPLFFFISGYLEKSKSDSFKTVVIKRAKRLIYPYFVYGSVIIIYNTIYYYHTTNDVARGILKRIVALIYGNFIFENNYAYIGTLWFLVASFGVSILFYWFHQTKSKWKYSVCIILAGFTETWLERKLHFRLPWCFDIAMVAFSFSVAGYFFKAYTSKVSNGEIRIWKGIILGILGVLMGCLNTQYMIAKNYMLIRTDMLYLNWGYIPLFLFSGISIAVSFSIISKFIFSKHRILILESIGRNSLTIMVVHLYIIQIVSRILGKTNIPAKSWMVFLIGLVISIFVSRVIEKYFPYLNDCSKLKIKKN